MTTAASIVPGLIGFAVLVALWPLAVWVHRRDQRRRAGSIERHNKERGDK
jgi:hypothetical protein